MDGIDIDIENGQNEDDVQQRDTGNDNFAAVHFIRTSGGGSNKKFIEKLMQRGDNPPHNRPLCTTLIKEDLPIGAYGSTCNDVIAGVVFDKTVCVGGFFPTDIFSLRFKKFDSNQPITPEQMNQLEKWQRSFDPPPKRPGNVYLRHSMKLTRAAALEKIGEVAYRSMYPEQDHSSTLYKSIDNKEIYTGIVGKYSKDPRNFKVLGNNVPPGPIRHNEAFLINCGLVDIKGVVVMEEDFYRKRAETLYKGKVLLDLINRSRSSITDSQIEGEKIKISKKIDYYQKCIALLTERVQQYTDDLKTLDNEGNVELDNQALKDAFSRKRHKDNTFDTESEDNKRIWLTKHIRQCEIDIGEMTSDIKNWEGEKRDDNIRQRLANEIKLFTYDDKRGKLVAINLAFEKKKDDELDELTHEQICCCCIVLPFAIINMGLQVFLHSDLKKMISGSIDMNDGLSVAVTIISQILMILATTKSIKNLSNKPKEILDEKSLSSAIQLASIITAGYFGYRKLTEELKKDGFSELNTHVLGLNLLLPSIAIANSIANYFPDSLKSKIPPFNSINKVLPGQQTPATQITNARRVDSARRVEPSGPTHNLSV